MRLLAPAKINLHLRVGPPRADGFHPLLTWMCTVGLFDTLTLAPSHDGQLRLACDRPEIPRDGRNLVLKAAAAFASAVGTASGEPAPSLGLNAVLEKRVPHGAGLGGGSSDAMRTLLGLNRLWNVNWPLDRLAAFAAQLGSDVPFFAFGSSSVCTGRGEVVTPIAPPAPMWVVLILPPFGVSTPAAYRRFDEMRLGTLFDVAETPPWDEWAKLPARSLLKRLGNDLERAAFSLVPELGQLRESAETSIGRIVRMSGSGSSLFALFDERDEAQAAADVLARQFPRQFPRARCEVVDLAPKVDDDLNENLARK